MTAVLSLVTTCKGRLDHLRQSLPRMAGQAGTETVVVDYDCPDGTGDWVAQHYPGVRVVRVRGVEGFNASHARNIGARAATAPWLGFFDADILLADRFSASVLPALRTGNYYRASPVTLQTWGSIICHRDDFFRINGYDEAYSGWGGEDDDLLAMLALHRVAGHGYPAALLDEVGHGDERRTQFAAVKNRWLQSRINQIYLHAKLDLIRLRGIPPTVQESRLIFAEIERTVLQANAAGNADCAINLSLPEQTLGSPPHDGMIELNSLARSLSYKLSFIGTRSSPGVPQLNLPMIDCGESA
jgi:glycosyltransferase involved in cell wall biosynthesis